MDDLLRRVEAALAGRYEIEHELGRGGMAVVFRGRDLRHERDVAIKVLPPHLASAIGHERFLHEIKLAAGLAHPYIVPILDSGEVDGLLFYTMPVVAGATLQERLRREGAVPIAEACTIACEVAEALAHAHAAHVLHRDVKPSNILLTRDHALLADFGVARAAEAGGDERLTGAGVIIGTPAYMSPQQALSDDGLDASADQYSLGCVVYEMLAGRVPFAGASAQAVLLEHASREPTPLRQLRPEIPRPLAAAVERAMAKHPEDRFPSIEAFREALIVGAAQTTGYAAEAPAWRRAVAVFFSGLLAVVGIWGAASLLSGESPSRDGAAFGSSRHRLAVLPCEVVMGTGYPGDSTLGRTTAMHMYFQLDGTTGLEVVPAEEVVGIPYPGEDSLATVAGTLGVGTLVQCVLSPGPRDSVRLEYDVWSDGSVTPYSLNLARLAPGMLDVERFAIRLLALTSGGEPFEPTESVLAMRSFLLGYDAFVGERFREAESLFANAVAQDSLFTLARWRQADVRRWMLEPAEGVDLKELYATDRERLGRRNALYLSAFAVPPEDRFARFEVVLDSLPGDAYAHLLYGDELLHRGPLYGFHLEAAEQVLRRTTQLNPLFAPAWDHLALVLMRLGKEAAADSALEGLERAATPSPADYPMPQLLRIAWQERFRHEERAAGRAVLTSDHQRLPAYARAGVRYFDLPELQLSLGLVLASEARPGSERWHSGTNATALAHAALGRVTTATENWRRAARGAVGDAKVPAGLFAALWSTVPAALGLVGFSPAAEETIAELEALAADTTVPALHRARADWALALRADAEGSPGFADEFERRRSKLRSLTEAHRLDARMSQHLDAVSAARRRSWRDALDASAALVAWDSVGLVDRPFNRAAFYLHRGAWYAELADEEQDAALADSAVASWLWHLNSDLERIPSRDVQAGEVDAVLGSHGRLRTARLAAERAGTQGRPERESWRDLACRESREVLSRWRDAERSFQPAIDEMQDVAFRLDCAGERNGDPP